MNEPDARLIYLFPGVVTFPDLVRSPDDRSRLCEIQWVDRAMFGNRIVVFTQAFHSAASAVLDREVRPGGLGEQMVFSCPTDGCDAIQVGDAVFKIVGIPDLLEIGAGLNTARPEFWARELELLEEGLVEPGAPVRRILSFGEFGR